MSVRLPIALWNDAQGRAFGVLLGDAQYSAAIAADRAGVRHQLVELASWLAENESWRLDMDWETAEPLSVRVKARPRYQDGARTLPVPQAVALKIPCIRLLSGDGAKLCVQPHLRLAFSFDQEADLRGLMEHYAQESLRAMTPWQLAAILPPLEYGIEFVSVALRDRDRRLPPEQRRELRVLFDVAEPLLKDRRLLGSAFGRQKAVADVAQSLASARGNILLVGPKGVGKTTLLCEAGRKAMRTDSDEQKTGELREYRLWRTSAARLIAGMRYLGQWEERVERVIEALSWAQGQLIAENLLELTRVGGSGPASSVAAFLVPYLQRGELRMVAEATVEEVQACRRLLPNLLDQFEQVIVPPFGREQALSVMREVVQSMGSSSVNPEFDQRTGLDTESASVAKPSKGARLAANAPDRVLALFQRFQPQACVPGPAVRLLRKLAINARSQIVDDAAIDQAFAQLTGLPMALLQDDVPLSFDSVCAALGKSVIGQTPAVHAAAQSIITLKAGLNDPNRPIAVLLFSGPTGTGKTALARALADYCFGAGAAQESMDASRLIRLDLSEYQGFDAAFRLLTDSTGLPARWLQQIDAQPFSVVLFDEIEKANPDIFDLLLGLLDEGRLSDHYGRRFDFRSAIIILTSNLGAERKAAAGFTSQAGSPQAAVSQFFRPEFFNRLDAVVPFAALDAQAVRLIAEKELHDVNRREGLQAHGLSVHWDSAVIDLLAQTGFDARYGARPLQRAVERHIVQAIAAWRLANAAARDRQLSLTVVEGLVVVG
jgi:ATP-dependent Clp protease ATP-binding subunit ClpC